MNFDFKISEDNEKNLWLDVKTKFENEDIIIRYNYAVSTLSNKISNKKLSLLAAHIGCCLEFDAIPKAIERTIHVLDKEC